MRQAKEMVVENCKFGFCSEDEICANSTPAKHIPSFTDIVDTDLTIGAQCELLKMSGILFEIFS